MPKETIADLEKFIAPYPAHVQELALWLRGYVWDLYPESNELIYDNYNAVAFGFSLSDRQGDTFTTIALFRNFVHFGFYKGTTIADPEKKLLGKGSMYRYIIVSKRSDFPEPYMRQLMAEAYANSYMLLKEGKQIVFGQTITKSISPIKRRPK